MAICILPAEVHGEVVAGGEVKAAGVAVGGLERKRGDGSRHIRANTASNVVLSHGDLAAIATAQHTSINCCLSLVVLA